MASDGKMHINELDRRGWWMVRRYKPPWLGEENTEWIDLIDEEHPDGYRPIYIPSTPCKIERSNVVGPNSGRDETGVMHIDWIRKDVHKVILHYNAITSEELAYMEAMMQGQQFWFKFPRTVDIQKINAYVGETNYQHYSYALADNTVSEYPVKGIYTDYEVHVIEL